MRNDSLLPICPRASTLFVQTLRGGGGGERERGCETKVSQNGSVTRKWGTVERLEIESDVISAWFFGSNFWGGLLSSSIFCDIDRVLFFLFWKFRSFLNPRSRRSHRWRWLSYMMARNFRYYILYIYFRYYIHTLNNWIIEFHLIYSYHVALLCMYSDWIIHMNFLFAISLIVKILSTRVLRYTNILYILCNFARCFPSSFFFHSLKRVYRVSRKL